MIKTKKDLLFIIMVLLITVAIMLLCKCNVVPGYIEGAIHVFIGAMVIAFVLLAVIAAYSMRVSKGKEQ